MKFVFVFFIIVISITSCTHKDYVVDPKIILKNVDNFWGYKQKYVRFYEDYKAVDEQSKPIDRGVFLSALSTGQYLPLRLKTDGNSSIYQLYKLPVSVDQNIKLVLQQWIRDEYDNYEAEGKILPEYYFTDMAGKKYSAQENRGKILVIKCWFVNCTNCVAEMPALNNLKKQYKERDDVEFLSLCLDSSDKVAFFLKKRKFDYAIVPDQVNYIENVLKIKSYPMHIVVDREGKILKKVNSYKGVVYALNKIF